MCSLCVALRGHFCSVLACKAVSFACCICYLPPTLMVCYGGRGDEACSYLQPFPLDSCYKDPSYLACRRKDTKPNSLLHKGNLLSLLPVAEATYVTDVTDVSPSPHKADQGTQDTIAWRTQKTEPTPWLGGGGCLFNPHDL